MHRLLLQRRWLRAIALVVLFSAACTALADWQWHRRVERLAQIALVTGNYDAAPVALADLLPPGSAALDPAATWRPVRVRGTYDAAGQLLVRHVPREGEAAGYEVLVPLRVDAADGGGVLLVDRGWVPPAPDLSPTDPPAPPAGAVEVVARLVPGQARDGRAAPPGQVQAVDLPGAVSTALAALGPDGAADAAALRTGGYGQLVSEDPAVATPAPALRPSLDEGPHLGYTAQWLLFAVGAWVFLVVHLRRAGYEADVAAGRRAPRAVVAVHDPRRRRSDEEVEDAALDAAERRRELVAAARREVGPPS